MHVARLAPAQLLAYVVFTAAMLFVVLQLEAADRRAEEQAELVCASSVDNRLALRQMYIDIADLGRALTKDSQPPERRAELNVELDRFQRERLTRFPELDEECAP